ncbi:hypothetical protein LOAG_10635 [Loa loa]|uniref:Uncharacterized protein n=1 Tax=Loa loa TaxID=7209 RepID=A0A1I7W3J6_LOALO|nr:hypothetical protein LOAG_10635 [Loa loa]EFO17862.1 hypothetical protein LOAG_10635 [Loa loa]
MYKDDENRGGTGAPMRRMIRRPRILARRVVRKKSPNIPSSIETADPKQCSIEKEEYSDDKMDEASRAEAIFGCAALGEIIRKNQPFPITEHVPVFDDSQLCMRFGNEEDVSDRVRMIGVTLAEHALKALRTVSENESRFQFTFPKEAAKVNLNSADDSASVSQILSGSHPVEQDNPSASSSRSPIILRITRTKSGSREVSTGDHTVRQHVKRKEYPKNQGKAGAVTRKKMAKEYDSPTTSVECGSSIKRRKSDADVVEHLTREEKALVDQVLLLCRQFIRSINYADASWYSKLKKAVYLRLQQLVENMKNTMSRRRELRERNEELRKLHQHLIDRNRISEPQYAYEEVLPDPSTENLDPQQSE